MLACIFGKPGEVFFPKLGKNQMLTFSSICDDFIKAQGFDKDECFSDAEAKHKAATLSSQALSLSSRVQTRDLSTSVETTTPLYLVVYFKSDTTGEKAFEEFYIPGEKLDMQRFKSLGVVEQTTRHNMDEVHHFFTKLEEIFNNEDFTKSQVVEVIKEFIPNFEHEEKGKNLDQKM